MAPERFERIKVLRHYYLRTVMDMLCHCFVIGSVCLVNVSCHDRYDYCGKNSYYCDNNDKLDKREASFFFNGIIFTNINLPSLTTDLCFSSFIVIS